MQNMKLLSLMGERKTSLRDRWLQRLFEGYPPETAIFLKKERTASTIRWATRLPRV